MKILAKVIAFLMIIVLMVSLPLSILLYNVGRVVFTPPLVKEILTEIVVDSDIISVGLQWFAEQRSEQRYQDGTSIALQDEPDILDVLSFVDIDGWQTIREEILPDDILADWVSAIVDGVYTWIDSEARLPVIVWDMQPFKQQVRSPHGANAVQRLYDALPLCSEDEIADFKSRLTGALPGMEVLYNLCQFPDSFGKDQIADYHASLILIVDFIPDFIDMTGELENIEDTQAVGPLAIKAQLLFLRSIMQLAPFIPVVLLLLILVLAIRSLAELGRWWGIPLIITAALLVILTAFYRAMIISVLSLGPMSEVPPLVLDEAIGGILQLAAEIFHPMMWQSIAILVLGLLLFIVGLVLKPRAAG
jgi:hypothetical protein